MSGRGGRRRPPRRPYYPNQRFRQYNQGDYNFSSDVNVDNPGGSFVYGSSPHPMQQHYHQPYGRGYGPPPQRGYGPPQHGFRGGYAPRFGYGPPRGFRPPLFRGRFPRHSGYGRGQFPRRPMAPGGMGWDSDDPYYHTSMFEDPWRYLMPQKRRRARPMEEEAKDGTDESKTEISGGSEGGDRTDGEDRVVQEDGKKDVENSSKDIAVDTSGEDVPGSNGSTVKEEEEKKDGEGKGVMGEVSVEDVKVTENNADLAREDAEDAQTTPAVG